MSDIEFCEICDAVSTYLFFHNGRNICDDCFDAGSDWEYDLRADTLDHGVEEGWNAP